MSSRTILLLTAALACLLLCAPARAEEPANAISLRTEKVIVFKDGYCLVIKRGRAVTNGDGEIFTEDVPDAAVLGSFWAIPAEGRIINMVAGLHDTTETAEKEVRCSNTLEILLANLGTACEVELHDKTLLTGTIYEVLAQQTVQPLTDPLRGMFGMQPLGLRHVAARSFVPRTETVTGVSGSHFILRTASGDVVLPVAQVRKLQIQEMKTTLKRTVTTKKQSKRLRFRFAEAGVEREIRVMYFRPGVRWIPTYRVHLDPDEEKKTAEISLQAEILNEAEDFEDVPFHIVVGVPNFRFRTLPSPLILEHTLRNALHQAAPQLMAQGRHSMSNALYSQRSAEFRRSAAGGSSPAPGAQVELPGGLSAAGAQDLFVYKLPRLTLKRGERTAVPVFTAQTTYRDVYTWDLHLKRKDIESAPSGSGSPSPLVLSKNEIWHQIHLVNNTGLPWTTGAALILLGDQPLAQELLTYTSPKDEVRIPITVSVDTRGSVVESEIGRKVAALKWSGYKYARIDKQAILDLCNNKSVGIDVEVTFHLGGKVTEASDEGTITLGAFDSGDWEHYRGSPAVNNSSTVRWEFSLDPGETVKPTALFHYFARH